MLRFVTHRRGHRPRHPRPALASVGARLARMRQMLAQDWVSRIGAVWSSTERKATDAAEILAAHLGLPVVRREDLGENDRSSTGYLPGPAFEAMADRFFAAPHDSIEGWERAVDAQPASSPRSPP